MPSELTATPAAPAEAGSGSAVVGDGSQPQSGFDGGQGEGADTQSGRQRAADGRFAQGEGGQPATETARSLESLLEAGDGVGTMLPAERKAIRLAAKFGFTTQEQVDAHITGKPAPVEGDKPPESPAQPQSAKGKNEPLATLIAAISPNLDPSKPEEALNSVKELQRHASTLGERNKELESYYPQVEAGIKARLAKGPEGLLELYAGLGVPVPDFLKNGTPAAPAAAPAGLPASMLDLDNVKDDDFVQGGQLKGLVSKLTSTIHAQLKADFEKEYGPLKETHTKIVGKIQEEAAANELKSRRQATFKDADFHSTFMSQFDPDAKLHATAEEIFNGSVTADGKMKAAPHAEWPKLKAILQARHDEYITAETDAATYQDFLYRKTMSQGNLQDMLAKAATKAKTQQLTAQQRRVQPAIVNKGNQGGLDSFVEPKTVEDVQNLTPAQRKAWKAKVMRGEITVR